ncbi:MAG: PilX N-terminal domain-containing pilus assembly protein [Thermomonas sp.]|uniref:pilus assembly PilX family protein n=1 Tax=Thermomonas sp. TaxID=1971895 RepID=UPI0039E4854F
MTSVRHQSGVSLLVVLLLLVMMTLLGLAVLRGSLLEERMSANMYDRSLAFQQAESALREAEATVRAAVQANGLGHVIGARCGDDPNSVGTITDANCVTPADAYTGGGTCASVTNLKQACWFTATDALGTANKSAGAPQYYVQFMGLRDSAQDLGLNQSASANQYGGSSGVIREAMYRIFARSHDASVNGDRSVVVLQGNVVVR